MNRRLFWIAFSFIIIFVTSICMVTVLIASKPEKNRYSGEDDLTNTLSSTKTHENPTENTTSKSTVFTEERISPSCNLSVETFYKKCGHTLLQNKTVPNDLVNLTREQLEVAYKDYRVISFSSTEIRLTYAIDEKCLQHYILKDKDGRITVFYQNPINNINIKKETDILVDRLPKDDAEKLKSGIEVNSDEELASFLEDLGS